MENNILHRELVEFSYNASDNENYIKDVYYESETAKAVQFTNQTSEKFFWMPKTMIQQGWKKDLKMPQNIKINYQLELYWNNRE